MSKVVTIMFLFACMFMLILCIEHQHQKCMSVKFWTYHIVIVFYADNKVQRRVSSVHDFVLSVFQEAALVLGAAEALPNQLALERDPLPDTEAIEVFG